MSDKVLTFYDGDGAIGIGVRKDTVARLALELCNLTAPNKVVEEVGNELGLRILELIQQDDFDSPGVTIKVRPSPKRMKFEEEK